MSQQHISTTTTRDVRTFSLLWNTSRVLLQKGLEEEAGSAYQFMASMIFSAFTLEAYLNHVGAKLLPAGWQEHQWLGPMDKLQLIAKTVRVAVHPGRRPWQGAKKLLDFRNALAHGRTETITKSSQVPLAHAPANMFLLKTKWEKQFTKSSAERGQEDVTTIIQLIHEAAKVDAGSSTDILHMTGLQSSYRKLTTVD